MSSQARKKEINTLNPHAKIGVSRSVASLKLTGQVNPVEVESHSLIQKAHELYNVKSK